MRRGDIRTITVEGRRLQAAYLGKGYFCRGAYHVAQAAESGDLAGRVVLDVDERDNSRAPFLAGPCTVAPNPHFPDFKVHEPQRMRGRWVDVYSCSYFRTVTAADTQAWSDLRGLQAIWERLKASYVLRGPLWCEAPSFNHDVAVCARDKASGVSASLADALTELANSACNFGSGLLFEFAARNCGVNDQGGLVLRDCLFDGRIVYDDRMKRFRQFRGW